MSRILAMPWNFPPGQNNDHRLVSIIDLEKGTNWTAISKYFKNYRIERTFLFGNQGLVQFATAAEAQRFVSEKKYYIPEIRATVTISPIPSIVSPTPSQKKMVRSQVICIQVIRLRCYLGIHDIYDECSHFGVVQKIICFEKKGKYALVQMENVDQAALALANLSIPNRYAPSFELRVQYSKNTNIVIQYNNSKSFDFTVPGALDEFELLREGLTNEVPYFEPESCNEIPRSFDFVRPVQFDPAYGNSLTVTGLPANQATFARNIFQQYGAVLKVKVMTRQNEVLTYIQMRNAFYARLAMTNLNGMIFNGKKVTVELSSRRDVHPESNDIKSQHDYQEFDYQQDDPDLQTFVDMWAPSKFVCARPSINLQAYAQISGAKFIQENNMLQFKSIDDATSFIGNFNPQHGNNVVLYYARPPNINMNINTNLVM